MQTLRVSSFSIVVEFAAGGVVAAIVGCGAPPSPSPPQPATPAVTSAPAAPPPRSTQYEVGIAPRVAPPLPAIPLTEGPLAIRLVFPEANQAISVRDSNFVFGSVGNGRATLTINGASVPVAPNGTFVGYLAVPPATAPRYELIARVAGSPDSARVVVPVRVPAPRVDVSSLTGRLVVDSASAAPRGVDVTLRDNEPVRVSIRAPANAVAWVSAGGMTQRLVAVSANGFATDVPARALRAGGTLNVARGADTVHFALSRIGVNGLTGPTGPSAGATVDSAGFVAPRWVSLGDAAAQRDTDAAIIGRDTPDGTYKWMLVPGTIAQETGRSGANVRVRLDSQLEVWVDSPFVKALPAGYPSPRRVVGAMALVPSADWVDIVMPVGSPPAYLIEQNLHQITLTLYGANATPETIKFLGNDSLVRMINWVPEATDRLRFTIELTRPLYGYLVLYDAARGFVLRVRRPPRVSLARPLEGLTIAVDPGHPPGGAIGPTGYTEAQGVLAVGLKLRDMLTERGARVVMTRTDMNAVDLHLRSVIARRVNAAALLSVHENAFGDGTNPFPNVGTSTLFFHPQSEPLARLIQAAMMREMGLRDLGVHYQNIAIGRTMWMPSIISEGLFLMMPEQEYAAKDPGFQERYARALADGVEAYFRTFAPR